MMILLGICGAWALFFSILAIYVAFSHREAAQGDPHE